MLNSEGGNIIIKMERTNKTKKIIFIGLMGAFVVSTKAYDCNFLP